MISEVVMPQMGADMTEGTVLRWLKHDGDAVERGEVIAEIETDKANVEIEAFEAGTFRGALAAEGDTVRVGDVIALIGGPQDDVSAYSGGHAAADASVAVASAAPAQSAMTARPAPPSEAPAAGPADGRLRASPVAKRIARERGIDLRRVHGSGPDGRILRHDVEQFAEPATAAVTARTQEAAAAARPGPSPAPGGQVVAMSRMRQAIARRMAQSKREAPHYYLLVDIDMTEAAALRRQINDAQADEAGRVSINDLIVKASALALQGHPMFNATLAGDEVMRHDVQNICIAIAMDAGLIAPAVMDAGRKRLTQIARETKDLAGRAKGGLLRAEEMSEGTFTITNLGAYGIETLIGIIQPPQTAILGVGSVMDQPVARDGAIVTRQMMKVALSADHRVTDGAQGAQFLGAIKALLEEPIRLLL
ncbi:MAG: 2-oxo acid dehydrogenase subunit E2 [Chloroflexota bacterium]|nr:2-oxo acid dehydrogenase subunit E2 [Chloroflexota bacterium]